MDMKRLNLPVKKSESCIISGANFCKFYHRPLDINSKPGDIFEAEEEGNFILDHSNESQTKLFVSRSTQTDYRESEVQTDPWDPPFKVLKALKEPEVLTLRNLSYGNGLPASQLEVNYISEARKLRNMKTENGGPVSDEAFLRKKNILCDQVRNEWNYRIAMLNEKQLEKLTVMQSTLADEIRKHSEKKEKILTNMWTNKTTDMSKQNAKLQQKLQKELRILESGFTSKKSADVLEVDKTLEIAHKPIKMSVSEGTEYMLSNYYLNNPVGLLTVKNWLDTKTDGLKTEIPLSRVFKRTQREKLAEKAYQNILDKKRTKLPPKLYHEDYVREEPPAPSVKAEDVIEFFDFQEKKVDLVTVWQQALRGLAHQKQMLELIECHKEGLSTLLFPLYPGIADS